MNFSKIQLINLLDNMSVRITDELQAAKEK